MEDSVSPEIAEELRKNLSVVDKEGRVVLQVALLATVYFERSHEAQTRAALISCCEEFARRYGEQLKWALSPTTDLMEPYGAGKGSTLSRWLPGLGEDEDFAILWHGAEDERGASEYSLEAQGVERRPYTELGFLRISVPLLCVADGADSFRELVLDICRRLTPLSGYAGIGVIESPDDQISSRHEPMVYQWAQRFPGLEADYPISHSIWLSEGREGGRDGIKGGSWLTVIGDSYVAELGGLSTVTADLTALDSRFAVQAYPGGLLIQTGSRPALGDAERDVWPALYIKLARYLRPIRVTEHNPFQHGGPGERFDKARSEAWLRRFDDR